MRIIAGKNRSRVLQTLDGMNTRPMTDRMKESVFNTIGPYFDNDIVLDLFGGSGALALEALSRGAGFAWICEKNNDAAKIIRTNISALKEDNNTRLLNVDYQIALKMFKQSSTKFDIIFLDPPYRLNIIEDIISFITENNLLKEDGILVCQYVKGNYIPNEESEYKIIKNYQYASSEMCIYQKKSI